MEKPAIEEKSQWRHKSRPSRKVRVTRVWDASATLNEPGTWGVSFDIHDYERNQMPWRDSSSVSAEQFLADYEPDLPARVVLEDQATELVAELITKVEQRTAPELVALRARIDRVLAYVEQVATPNTHTLGHIRRMLTTDDKH